MKANCYECKYRGSVPGSCHSSCNYPGTDTGILSFFASCNFALMDKLNIKAEPHGVKSGWFMWPVDFDPVWLRNCDGFILKEKKQNEKEQP